MKHILIAGITLVLSTLGQAGTTTCSNADQTARYFASVPDTGIMIPDELFTSTQEFTLNGKTYRDVYSGGVQEIVEFGLQWDQYKSLETKGGNGVPGVSITTYTAKALVTIPNPNPKKKAILLFDGFLICENAVNYMVP